MAIDTNRQHSIWDDTDIVHVLKESGVHDEASLREALGGPNRDQLLALLLPVVNTEPPAGYDRVGPDIQGNGLRQRTETAGMNENVSLHAEKNQDIEFENAETHFVPRNAPRASRFEDSDIAHVSADDGPSHLLGDLHGRVANSPSEASQFWADWNGLDPFERMKPHQIAGDWNGDGPDTLGFGDFNLDGTVDAADYVL